MAAGRGALAGHSLIELLCVMGIISILASLLLPAVIRAYSRVKDFAQEWDEGPVFSLLTTETRQYCATHPQYLFPSKSDFVDKCHLAPQPSAWVLAQATQFVPFGFPDDTNKVVLTFHIGPKHATVYSFTKGELTITPPAR